MGGTFYVLKRDVQHVDVQHLVTTTPETCIWQSLLVTCLSLLCVDFHLSFLPHDYYEIHTPTLVTANVRLFLSKETRNPVISNVYFRLFSSHIKFQGSSSEVVHPKKAS